MADALWRTSTISKATAVLNANTMFRVVDDPSGAPSSKHTTAGSLATYVATTLPPPGAASLAGIFYTSTMLTTNTGAANAAALVADVTAANGMMILVKPGTYTVANVTLSGKVVNIWFLPGSLIVPDASLHSITGQMFQATSCDTNIYGLNIDAQNLPCGGWRSDFGSFWGVDCKIINMGFEDLVGGASHIGTYGFFWKTVDSVYLNGYVARDFVGRLDGVYANNSGKVNPCMIYECFKVHIENADIDGGRGEDYDHFHILDLRTPTRQMKGTIKNSIFRYTDDTRRCLKFQGGDWDVEGCIFMRSSSFTAVAPGAMFSGASAITNANPAVVTATAHGFVNGQIVTPTNAVGMTTINGNSYTVANTTANTFELSGTDSTVFGVYASGAEFRRVWNITGATNTNPVTVTSTAHTLTNSGKVVFAAIGGMTQLNGNTYSIANITANTFDLVGIDGTAFGVYTSGGTLQRVTEIGQQNLNMIDWAGSLDGEARISNCVIDGTGFGIILSQSAGPLGKIVATNNRIVGSKLHALRNNPEALTFSQDIECTALYCTGTSVGFEARGNYIVGCVTGCSTQGGDVIVEQNTFDDPSTKWINAGSTVQRSGITVRNNIVLTRTPGDMSVTPCGQIQNYLDLRCNNNVLKQRGNTTHSTPFIKFTNASASGSATGNEAPSGTIPAQGLNVNVAISASSRTPLAPLIDLVSIGNITTGEDTLHTHLIPAGQLSWGDETLEVIWNGSKVNNANVKTLRVYIGATLVGTKILTASVAAGWRVILTVTSTGLSTQRCVAEFYDGGVATAPYDSVTLDTTEVSSSTITLKLTGDATATNDIVNSFSSCRSLTGRALV